MLNSTLRIPLRGIAIGNGWIDANNHYLSYLDYAVKVELIEENTDVRCVFFFLNPHIHLKNTIGLETRKAGDRYLHCLNREDSHEPHVEQRLRGRHGIGHESERTNVGHSVFLSIIAANHKSRSPESMA